MQWIRDVMDERVPGGRQAARRNAAPVGFVLPKLTRPAVHEVLMDEAHDFEPRHSVRDGQRTRQVCC